MAERDQGPDAGDGPAPDRSGARHRGPRRSRRRPSAVTDGHAPEDAGFLTEVRNAVTLRAALLVVGVLVLQLAFVASYVGAFHAPQPREVPVAVVAPEPMGEQLTRQLATLPDDPLDPRRADDADAARDQVAAREVDGGLIVDPRGDTDRLLVASGAGDSLAESLTRVVSEALREQGRSVTVEDVAPSASGDAGGLASFYLVVGWCVGGYLCAAALAVSRGAQPATVHRAVIRLLVLLLYSLAAGVGGALLVGPVFDALPAALVPLSLAGALVVFATGAATLALQGLLGVAGIGVAILLVVIVGNPSAGGAYAGPLLPPFWETVGGWLIPGAGTWLARSLAYFDGQAVTGPLVVLAAWAVLGVLVTLAAVLLRSRRGRRPAEEPAPAAGTGRG